MKARKARTEPGKLSYEEFVAISKAVSDPRRYDILQTIAGKEDCTCVELRAAYPISAATLSHHLKELESARLINISRNGKFALPSFRREVWKKYLSRLSTL
jgi:ArsR family transcriptional regulator